jgi:hypothetical protein
MQLRLSLQLAGPVLCERRTAGMQVLHHWQMVLWKCSRHEAAHPALAGRLIQGAVVLDQLKLRWVLTWLNPHDVDLHAGTPSWCLTRHSALLVVQVRAGGQPGAALGAEARHGAQRAAGPGDGAGGGRAASAAAGRRAPGRPAGAAAAGADRRLVRPSHHNYGV